MTPSRPYIMRALYEWIVDNDCTPYVLVDATVTDVMVPQKFVKDGQIVLNISPGAVMDLNIGNDAMVFNGRFGGVATDIYVPVGAVVLVGGEIVARRHNERQLTGDPTAHAEILALRDAASAVDDGWRLTEATLVVTLEPCAMCAGAALNSRIARVVYGAADMKAGAVLSLMGIGSDPRLNHEFEVVHGVRADECADLLTSFFSAAREQR